MAGQAQATPLAVAGGRHPGPFARRDSGALAGRMKGGPEHLVAWNCSCIAVVTALELAVHYNSPAAPAQETTAPRRSNMTFHEYCNAYYTGNQQASNSMPLM